MKEKTWKALKKSVSDSRLTSQLKDHLTIEAHNLAQAGAEILIGKVSEYLPFATATATKISMEFMKSAISESMLGTGSSGAREIRQGVATGYIAGKKVNNYAVSFNFNQPKSKQLRHLVEQNAISKIQVAPYIAPEYIGDAAKCFFQSGVNSKGVCQWSEYGNSTGIDWADLDKATPMQLAPLSWNVEDDEVLIKADPGLPTWPTMLSAFGGSDQSIRYPIVSRHIDFQLFNSNAFMPCRVKVYLCKRKGQQAFEPASDWFLDPLTGQNQNYMDIDHTNAWNTVPGTEIFEGPNTSNWIQESSINLNAYPAMSANFNERWEIVEVKSQRLDALESLNVTCNIHAGELYDFRNLINQKLNEANPRMCESFPYTFMIEFQGDNGLIVPRNTIGNIVVDGSPLLVDAMPTKLRFRYRKHAKVAYPSIDTVNQQNIYTKTFTDTSGNLVSIPLGAMAGVISENTSNSLPQRYYSPYRRLSDELGQNGTYYIPIYTDQEKQVAKPLANQQP